MIRDFGEKSRNFEMGKNSFPDGLITKIKDCLSDEQVNSWIWKKIIKDLEEYKELSYADKISSLEILLYNTTSPNFEADYYEKRHGGTGTSWKESDDYLKYLEAQYEEYILAEAKKQLTTKKNNF